MKVYGVDYCKTKQYRFLMPVGALRPFVEKPLREQIQEALGLVNKSEYLVFSEEEIAQIKELGDKMLGGAADAKAVLAYVMSWLPGPEHYQLTSTTGDADSGKPVWLCAIRKL